MSPTTRAVIVVAQVMLLALPACGGADPGGPASEVSSDSGASPQADAAADAGGCNTWTCLYSAYFGSSGVASCAGTGSCHGSPNEPGYGASMYLCPPGDKDACYAGITSTAAHLLTPGVSFESTPLYANLRKSSGGGTMPKAPGYAFTPADLDKISRWVAAGAKND